MSLWLWNGNTNKELSNYFAHVYFDDRSKMSMDIFNVTQISESIKNMDSHVTFWFVFIAVFLAMAVAMMLFLAREMCCYACYCVRITVKSTNRRVRKLLKSRGRHQGTPIGENSEDVLEEEDDHGGGSELTAIVGDEISVLQTVEGTPTQRNVWETIVAYCKICDHRQRNSVATVIGDNLDTNSSSL